MMKLISLNLTELQIEIITKLVDKKLYPNRSEAIRSLINRGLESKVALISKSNKEYLEYFDAVYEDLEITVSRTNENKNGGKTN